MHVPCLLGCRWRILILRIFGSVVLGLFICKAALADDESKNVSDGFHYGGYSSAGVNIHPGGDTDAALNQISLILRWEGDSRFRYFSEIELERPVSWHEGEHFTDDSSYVDVERLYVDYNLSEKLNLRAGRFLTPAGWWNLIHAAPLVWTSTRPLATSRLFPQSTNGAMFYGAIPLGSEALEYSLYIEALKDQYQDDNEVMFKNTRGARLTLSGKVNWGLSVMEFNEDIAGDPKFRMLGLDFLINHEGWEFSGEAFQRFYTSGKDGGSGAYLQGVAPLGNEWFAVSRLETFARPTEGSSERWLLGTAWRMSPSRVLKMEYVGGDSEREGSPKGFLASFAILF